MSTKRAVVVGLNYNAKYDYLLKAYINSAKLLCEVLKEDFGYEEENICFIHDGRPFNANSGSFILSQLRNLITSSIAGDEILFYFAGHGNSDIFIDDNGVEHVQQSLCCGEKFLSGSLTWITDKELKDCLNMLAEGVYFTMILDCCFSGNLIDGLKQQLTCKGRRGFADILDVVGGEDTRQQRQLVSLFSACQRNQVAWETRELVNGQIKPRSVFTDTLLEIVRNKGGCITNRELMTELNKVCSVHRCIQTPGLFCTDDHSYSLFLGGKQPKSDALKSIYCVAIAFVLTYSAYKKISE
ncbi:metacaspase-8-like [Cicer arietinum]|uniref:Uncharacterized protein LOC101514729 n=1 Tax=Cicer arietinum TaxID=3827 RepID=A0A1S2XJB2_CICAR|nr:uncharacterized protein LOC101514729 [Cicer arietinum]